MVFTHRLGGRMDRQPDFQGQRLRIAGQSDRRSDRRHSGRLARFFVRMGSDGHMGNFPRIDHRRHRPAVDRIAVHTAQTR